MISAESFFEAALAAGFDACVGVPCSFLTPIINRAIGEPRLGYVGATSEGEAVGIAAGAWLAGKKPMVMFQNSGLGNAVNPLTSLAYPFRIPLLAICTWRGQPGVKDEPQHELMGRITGGLFEMMRIPALPFPREAADLVAAIAAADAFMAKESLPFALVMAKESVADEPLRQEPWPEAEHVLPRGRLSRGDAPTRCEALQAALGALRPETAVIATTGKTGRELFTLADRPQFLYLVGSMGCASAVGLGVALNVERPVLVLDGDGAALMKMGNLATIGAYRPRRLIHVVLDNGVHDSTGGQRTVSPGVDFAAVAAACGYRRAVRCDGLSVFAAELAAAQEAADGPALLHLAVRPGSIVHLGRPTVTPPEVARRFRAFLAE
jgi:phosphonopyruvate decarboxylase